MLQKQLQEKQKSLEPHFKPGLLQRDLTIFQFKFGDPDESKNEARDEVEESFFLTVSPDSFMFSEGEASAPTLTLFLDRHETCWQLLTGTLNGMKAFMNGRYRADGHIVLSQLLLYLFKSDDPSVVFKVQD